MPPWMAAGVGATALPRSSPGLPIPFVQGAENKMPIPAHPSRRTLYRRRLYRVLGWRSKRARSKWARLLRPGPFAPPACPIVV